MLGTITQEQHTAARVARFMYLLLGALAAWQGGRHQLLGSVTNYPWYRPPAPVVYAP